MHEFVSFLWVGLDEDKYGDSGFDEAESRMTAHGDDGARAAGEQKKQIPRLCYGMTNRMRCGMTNGLDYLGVK